MPIFEYHCEACDKHFERITFTKDSPTPECPLCGSSKVKKMVSAPSVSGGSDSSFAPGGSSCGSGGSGGFR